MATSHTFGAVLLVFSSVLSLSRAETKPNITFHLEEEMPNNTLIGSIIEELDMASQFTAEQLNNMGFNYLAPTPLLMTLFRIDSSSSKIFTTKIINRESEDVCKFSMTCFFDFDVVIAGTTTNHFAIITIRINITDKNDNTPTFPSSEMELNIYENIAITRKFPIETAQDLDRGSNNSIQDYELVSLNPQSDFALKKESSQTDGSLMLYLQVNTTELDRERRSYYNLLLLAKDGGVPRRTGTLTIKINILDENDNKPVFKDSAINITVTEEMKPKSLIFTLTATDKDAGKNGEVIYRFRKDQPQEIYDLFSIGETNGQLITESQLLYVPGKVYTIIVEALDKGDTPQIGSTIVRLTVQDTGNNAPQIGVTFLSGGTSNVVQICECAQLEQFVAHIQVTDTDTGENGKVSCTMRSTYFGLSSLGNKGYRVIVQAHLDRETIAVHNLTVKCSDNGKPQMTATSDFTVILTDSNDNAPKFTEHYYTVSMDENNKEGQEVIKITATDKDIGRNGEISYFILPPMDKQFRIDSKTGQVIALKRFDREQEVHVRFDVVAQDNGIPERKNFTTAVIVNIEDVNDNSPEFLKSIFQFKVKESSAVGEPVGSVTAIDEDKGDNGKITYRLQIPSDVDPSTVPFKVFSTGEIKTTELLDREDSNSYNFDVEAFDSGSPSLTSSTKVNIIVQDVNDNAPQFIFPNKENFTIKIPHNTPMDSIIASIQAYDEDEGENRKVMYFIKAGDDENKFYLNHETGGLYVRKTFDITKDKLYTLTLQVKDRGSPVLSTERDLLIIVSYINTTVLPQANEEDVSDKFVLIVVSVVCVTVVLSILLLAVICILRKRDKDKNNNAGLNFPTPCEAVPNMYEAAGANSNQKSYLPPTKGKPKVSFTLETNRSFTKKQLLQKLTGSPTGNTENHSNQNDMEKLVVQIPKSTNLYAHEKISDKQTKPSREESPSETSGETLPSDSGHGGSEEEFVNSTAENPNTFALDPLFVQGKDTPGIFVIRQHSQGSNKDVPIAKSTAPNKPSLPPPAYSKSQYPHKANYMDDSLLTTSMNSIWSDPASQNSHRHHQTLPTIHAFSNLKKSPNIDFNGLFYKDGTLGSHSAHSRDDDDCTTTSGSYTINSDQDFDDEFLSQSKDLYV